MRENNIAMFNLIEEASSIPLTLENGYKRQNKILQNMRYLYTSFEGIKLNHKNKYSLPIIKKGSICLFCFSFFEATKDIILEDKYKREEGSRYIIFKLANQGKNLIVDIIDSLDSIYSEELGGFYHINKKLNTIIKYLPYNIYYKNGIYDGHYFDNYNNEVF